MPSSYTDNRPDVILSVCIHISGFDWMFSFDKTAMALCNITSLVEILAFRSRLQLSFGVFDLPMEIGTRQKFRQKISICVVLPYVLRPLEIP